MKTCLCKVPVILVKILMNLEYFRQILENSDIKFHQNPSSNCRVLCGLTKERTDGRTDMTKLILHCRNFANASKMRQRFVTFSDYRAQFYFQCRFLRKKKKVSTAFSVVRLEHNSHNITQGTRLFQISTCNQALCAVVP